MLRGYQQKGTKTMKLGNRALLTVSKPEGMEGINAKALDTDFVFFTEEEMNDGHFKSIEPYCRTANLTKTVRLYVAKVEKAYIDEDLDAELKKRERTLNKNQVGLTFKGEAMMDKTPVGIFQYYSGDDDLKEHTVNRSIKEILRIHR